jgi:hypothetical protein
MSLLREPRLHDDEFLKRVRQLPCLFPMCNRQPVEAAHIRQARADLDITEAGIGQKPHDAMVVPLCEIHHRIGQGAEHRIGSKVFWRSVRIDPHHVALRLYIAHRRISDDMEAVQAMRSIVLEERFAAQ